MKRGCISSIFGAVFYTVSKEPQTGSWSITADIQPKQGEQRVILIRGFRLRKDALSYVDRELEFKLIGA